MTSCCTSCQLSCHVAPHDLATIARPVSHGSATPLESPAMPMSYHGSDPQRHRQPTPPDAPSSCHATVPSRNFPLRPRHNLATEPCYHATVLPRHCPATPVSGHAIVVPYQRPATPRLASRGAKRIYQRPAVTRCAPQRRQ